MDEERAPPVLLVTGLPENASLSDDALGRGLFCLSRLASMPLSLAAKRARWRSRARRGCGRSPRAEQGVNSYFDSSVKLRPLRPCLSCPSSFPLLGLPFRHPSFIRFLSSRHRREHDDTSAKATSHEPRDSPACQVAAREATPRGTPVFGTASQSPRRPRPQAPLGKPRQWPLRCRPPVARQARGWLAK